MSDIFNFSTEPVYMDFSIDGKSYRLREAGEGGIIAYKNCALQNLVAKEVGDSKTVSASGGAEADAILISQCLFTLGEGGKESSVSLQRVKELPYRITVRLYKWIRANSGMDEEQETQEFLTKRIQSDSDKLTKLVKDGTPGKDVPSSTSNT